MLVSRVVLLTALVLVCFSCKDSADSDPADAGAGAGSEAAAGSPRLAALRSGQAGAGSEASRLEETPCDSMLSLLIECNTDRRKRFGSVFKKTFVRNCQREFERTTAYARSFVQCVGSNDCDELKNCSDRLARSVEESGAEHVEALLKEGRRTEAKEFCFSNRTASEKSADFHRICHDFLEEADQQQNQQHSCPFH